MQVFRNVYKRMKQNQFLFEELVKRDFKQKYKRTILGMGWSILSPLLQLLVMRLIFTNFFGRSTEHYTTYLFTGNLLFAFFKESTTGGMSSLMSNRQIFSKINVPKYIFLLSKNVSAIINFGLTLILFFIFAALDGVTFTWRFLLIIYPVLYLIVFNIGVGLILSALYIFFRDIQYLYDILTLLLMYMSVIFYNLDGFSAQVQNLFLLNPIYCAIKYVRTIVLDASIPSPELHVLMSIYAILAVLIGGQTYKKKNHDFLYYV